MVIGMAGPMGAGKDQFLEVFQEFGFKVENLDTWGHKALDALATDLAGAFGPGVMTPKGTIDRKALGTRVFASAFDLRTLEALVHPWMRAQIQELLAKYPQKNFVLNAAILHKLGMEVFCHKIIWITAPICDRLFRIKSRDNLSFKKSLQRLWTQRDLRPKQFSRKVDILIKNKNGELDKSREKLRVYLRQWVNE